MARCDDLATQLSGLQNQLSGLQNQLSGLQSQLSDLEYQRTHPNEACADQELTGIDCELYLRGLGPQIRSTESQISGVQGQIAGVQAQITNVQQQQQKYWCSPVFGSDGTPLTITSDDQGNVTAAEAVGTDGVKRAFNRTSAFSHNTQGWYYTVMRQEFFENDQRYFYVTVWVYLGVAKVSVSMSGGGKDYGFSINFPADGSHDQTTITLASGAIGQSFTTARGTLNLNQGSLSAPSFTADFTIPPEIEQQVSKTAYFQQLFDQENTRNSAKEASALQAAGITLNMTLNQALYGQVAGQATMTLRPLAGGWNWGREALKAACWMGGTVAGKIIGAIPVPGSGVVGDVLGSGLASVCSDYVDSCYENNNPPPLPPPVPLPPDASVPIDGGDPMSSGGDPGGQCIGPPVTSEQSVIVPFDDFVCL